MSSRYSVIVNRAWCKNCGICAAYCPQRVLGLNDKKILSIEKEEACSGCRMCEYRCPDLAITVEDEEAS